MDIGYLPKSVNIRQCCPTNVQSNGIKVQLPRRWCPWVSGLTWRGTVYDWQDVNAGEYVLDLIRRDQDYQDRRKTLVAALVAGEASGPCEQTLAEIWQSVKVRHGLDV